MTLRYPDTAQRSEILLGSLLRFLFGQHTGIPSFSEMCITPLCFQTYINACFPQLTEIQRGFLIFQSHKAKLVISVSFAGDTAEAVGSQPSARPAKLLPGTTFSISASQHLAARAMNCVWEHLSFISICSVSPLARRLPGKSFLGFMPFRHKRSCRKARLAFRTVADPCNRSPSKSESLMPPLHYFPSHFRS